MTEEIGPQQTPYYHALQSERYARQELIAQYENLTDRGLVVLIGALENDIVPPFVDALTDIDKGTPLDLLIMSSGGDAEAALRIAKLCHAGRDDFRVVVPDQAKSAATLLALAAEELVMSDTSDLGPIDPQILMRSRGEYVPAKDIIEIVDDLEMKVKANPDSYPFYAAFLADIDAVVYQRARAAASRTEELVEEFFQCRSEPPSKKAIKVIAKSLQSPAAHTAVVDHTKAASLGLPVSYVAPNSGEWQILWRLFTKYHAMGGSSIFRVIIEGRRVSLIQSYS